jgi:tetratricopeptide (TPR) repeat protein
MALQEGRYSDAQRSADRAIQAAEKIGNPELLVRALLEEQTALRMAGDFGAAMVRSTRILAMAEDPATRDAFNHRPLARAVSHAYTDWIAAARMDSRNNLKQMLKLLDVADRWLSATGHSDWRSSVLLQRAAILSRLDNEEKAISLAQEALATYSIGSPGYSLASHHAVLGRLLAQDDRHSEARRHFQAILDDPAADANARVSGYIGLTYCALDADQPREATRYAEMAVSLAENCSEDETAFALDGLVRALRKTGDRDGAWSAATREFELAQRTGRYRLYYAVKSMVDVALDRGDLEMALKLIEDLDEHAAALDAAQGSSKFSRGVARRRRLAGQVHRGQEAADQHPDLEYPDEQLSQQDIEPGHGGFKHYVAPDTAPQAMHGQKALVALCGWKWIPERTSETGDDLSDLPICPKCKARHDALLFRGDAGLHRLIVRSGCHARMRDDGDIGEPPGWQTWSPRRAALRTAGASAVPRGSAWRGRRLKGRPCGAVSTGFQGGARSRSLPFCVRTRDNRATDRHACCGRPCLAGLA